MRCKSQKILSIDRIRLDKDICIKNKNHENCTTPHPPAAFGSEKFFSFDFLQIGRLTRATTRIQQRNTN